MKTMKMTVPMLSACMFITAHVVAADLILAPNESHTVQGTESYDRVIVNGDLTVGTGATLETAYLCVASNITGTANLILGENSRLNVTGSGDNDCLFGAAGGTANVDIRGGARFTVANNLQMLSDPGSPAAFSHVNMTVSNATVFVTNFVTFLKGRTGSNTERVVNIRLDAGAAFNVKRVVKSTLQETRILFNGGKLNTLGWDGNSAFVHTGSNNSSKFLLEATNANSVAINVGSSRSSVFGLSSQSAIIEVCGDGDLSISGSQSPVNIASSNNYWKANLRFGNTGALRFGNKRTQIRFSGLLRDDANSPAHDVIVENGASLEVENGSMIVTKSLTVRGNGTITNTSSSANATVVVGVGDGDSAMSRALPPRIDLVKRGAGRLAMCASDIASVRLEGGELALMSREEIGYPIYRFNVYDTGNAGSASARVNIGELNYLNGTEDVTQGWTGLYYDPTGTGYYNDPVNMFDGTRDTFFYDQRAQNYGTISNIHVELEHNLPHKVTGYRWNRQTNLGSSHGPLPKSWAVLGSEDNTNWRLLSLVEGLETSWSENWRTYQCTNYPETVASVANITVGNGVRITAIGPDVTFSAGTFAADMALTLAKGARVTLPASAEVARLDVDAADGGGTLVNFRPAANGELHITGGSTRPIPVSVENLLANTLVGWSVYVDGVLRPRCHLAVSDGQLIAFNGLSVCIR